MMTSLMMAHAAAAIATSRQQPPAAAAADSGVESEGQEANSSPVASDDFSADNYQDDEVYNRASGSASAKTSIYVDGAVALMSAANQDNAKATITIDGKLTSGQSASPSPALPSVDYIPSQAYNVASDGSVTNASGQAVGPSITLDNGQVIRFAANGNDLYTFLGSSGSSVGRT
jgi:hypothetical protein